MKIEKVDNGYIVSEWDSSSKPRVFLALLDVFRFLLVRFEGRSPYFAKGMFGDVVILDNPPELNMPAIEEGK